MEIIGLLNQSAKAKKETYVGSEREQISLAYTSVLMKKATTESLENRVEAIELENEINDTYGANTVTVTENDDGTLKVVYEDSKRVYKVKNDGKIDSSVNYEEIFKTATKHPDQEDTNDIGIAEDGSAVNLDFWLYVLNSDGASYCLNSSYDGSGGDYGYSYLEIEGGKIKGKVPMWIKEEDENKFYAVKSMKRTFYACTNLTTAPEIPSSVTNMFETFYGCTNLKTAPEIPGSVTNMYCTFSDCTNLKTAPEIPSSVTNMVHTFSGCTNLTTAPVIPSSVTDMNRTFYCCTNLTGELIINANPSTIIECLSNAVSGPDCSLVLKGECPREKLIEIALTAGSGSMPSNITIGK